MRRASFLRTAAHDALVLLFVLTAVAAGVVLWNSTDGVFYADVVTSRGPGTVPKFGLAWWERAAVSSVAGAAVGGFVAGAAWVAARAAGGIAGIGAAGGGEDDERARRGAGPMRRRRVWLVAVGAVVALLASWGVWWGVRRGDGQAPADRSSTLEGVVEPIAIVFGMSLDDGGSKAIQFRDARRAERELCLEYHLNWENDPNDSDGHRNLYLGSLFPRGRGSRRLPVSGAEERALLGILERWARADEEASEIDRRYALLERGELEADAFWEGLRDEHRVKGIAVSILRELRRRN